MAPVRLQPESQGGGVVNQRGYGESPPSSSSCFALTADGGLDTAGEEEEEQEEEGQAATECGVSKEMSGKHRKKAGATEGNRDNTEGRSGDTTQVSWQRRLSAEQLERVRGAT